MAAPASPAHPFDPFADDKKAALTLILEYIRNGDFDGALSQADDAIAKFHKHGPFYTLKAQILIRAGRVPEALPTVERAIALDPKYALSYWVRGLIYQQQHSPQAALADFDRAIALDDSSRAIKIQATGSRGMVLVDLGRYREAVADLDAAIEARPNAYAERQFRARAQLALNDPIAAEIDIDTLRQWDPHNPTVLRLQGELALKRGDAAQAIRPLDAALAANPKDGRAYWLRAQAQRLRGNERQARTDLRAACKWGEISACPSAPSK